MEIQIIWNSQNDWKKLKKCGGLVVPDFRVYVCAAITQTVWIWCNDKQTDQWNSIKSRKLTHKYMFTWFFTKVQRELNDEKKFQQIVWQTAKYSNGKSLFLI